MKHIIRSIIKQRTRKRIDRYTQKMNERFLKIDEKILFINNAEDASDSSLCLLTMAAILANICKIAVCSFSSGSMSGGYETYFTERSIISSGMSGEAISSMLLGSAPSLIFITTARGFDIARAAKTSGIPVIMYIQNQADLSGMTPDLKECSPHLIAGSRQIAASMSAIFGYAEDRIKIIYPFFDIAQTYIAAGNYADKKRSAPADIITIMADVFADSDLNVIKAVLSTSNKDGLTSVRFIIRENRLGQPGKQSIDPAADMYVSFDQTGLRVIASLEAAALKIPPVYSEDNHLMREMFGSNGYMIKDLHPASFLKLISSLLNNRKSMIERGLKAMNIVKRNYIDAESFPKLHGIITSVIKRSDVTNLRLTLGGSLKNHRWWLVYGLPRSGTSYLTRQIASSAKLMISDWCLGDIFRVIVTNNNGKLDKKRFLADMSKNILSNARPCEGALLDFVFKQGFLTPDEYACLVGMWGEPEKKIFCLRNPAGYIASAVKKFVTADADNLRKAYASYLLSDAFKVIGGDIFEYHDRVSTDDITRLIAPLPADRTNPFVYLGEESASLADDAMREAYQEFTKAYALRIINASS